MVNESEIGNEYHPAKLSGSFAVSRRVPVIKPTFVCTVHGILVFNVVFRIEMTTSRLKFALKGNAMHIAKMVRFCFCFFRDFRANTTHWPEAKQHNSIGTIIIHCLIVDSA